MANNKIDIYINTLQIGSEVMFDGRIYIIQSYDKYEAEVLEKGENNPEELLKLTWGEIAEELELFELSEEK